MPAEAGVVPHFRPHAEIGAHPEILDIEVLADLRIVEFVRFLLRNRARDGRDVGDLSPSGNSNAAWAGAVTNDMPAAMTAALKKVANRPTLSVLGCFS